jgi:signal transduction histidine kinase
LFRIAQEAVNNAIRHGNAGQITIRLARVDDRLVLEVRDDGRGLPAGRATGRGLGLRTMKHRADLIGAQFAVASPDSRGTVVSCVLPARSLPSPKPA